jgi:hypothetical protein
MLQALIPVESLLAVQWLEVTLLHDAQEDVDLVV